VRTHARQLVSRIKGEQLISTPESLKDLQMFDETEEMERIGAMNGVQRIRDPARERKSLRDRFGTTLPERPVFFGDTGGSEWTHG
jgi:hypothetical protein